MSFFTVGLYGFYWSYRNWCAYRVHAGSDVSPRLRTLLAPLFLYALMRKVDAEIRSSGRSYSWSPLALMMGVVLVSCGFFALFIIVPEWLARDYPALGRWGNARVNSEILLLSMVLPVLLFLMGIGIFSRVQTAINFCERDPQGKRNFRLSSRERDFLSVGALFWFAYALLLFLSVLFWWGMRGF
ncbi:hypothetical protein ACIP1T_02265 [Pseudomonas japonica]|uniref:hypothetical protein n=1 Tax=Pseudomonas japonica TaxID=256466 RepID=UPI0037FC28C5